MTRAERNRELARRGGLAAGVSLRVGRPIAGRNPTTSDVIYSDDQREFMLAIAAYQKRYRCRQPTCGDILSVARELGYRKVAEPSPSSAS